jgi:hypothetical protein
MSKKEQQLRARSSKNFNKEHQTRIKANQLIKQINLSNKQRNNTCFISSNKRHRLLVKP